MIWKQRPDLYTVNTMMHSTMMDHLEIKVVNIGGDYIKATMPLTAKTR